MKIVMAGHERSMEGHVRSLGGHGRSVRGHGKPVEVHGRSKWGHGRTLKSHGHGQLGVVVYLSKLSNLFFQIVKCICPNYKSICLNCK